MFKLNWFKKPKFAKSELYEIVHTHKWIKVKKFDEVLRPTDDVDVMYAGLVEHHKAETEFLINKCKELAQELLNK